MTAKTDAKPFYATRDFRDAGTGRRFEGGKPIDAEPGEIANYEAAGLASDKKADAKADAPVA